MKKYIMFFISIGLLLGIVLFYNTMNIEQSKKVTFSESGYILNNSTDRYYFYQDETYTTSYNNKIVFYDTEGTKVTLDNNNFIHYSNGNIVGLQQGVLLDLSVINNNPIIYYNVNANKEIKKVSNRYIIKNLDKDLQFEQAIWKISATKYIILGNNIKIKLQNGTEKDVQGYVEIEYSDNEIINIYNQEISYQTISSDSYIELDKDIKINLGTKIVSKKDENKMSLEDMVINSDDNVTLVDINVSNEEENDIEEENTTDENKNESNSTTIQTGTNSNSSTVNSSSSNSTIVNQGNGSIQEGKTDKSDDEDIIEIDTPNIKYDKSDNNETEIDASKVLEEPKFKIENMEVTALSVEGTIKITDENDLLSKDENIEIKIINNSTGKNVYTDYIEYGTMSIPLTVETLIPNTQYTIVVSATYVVNEVSYTKNFIYKTFVTSKIGINIEKNGFTDKTLSFTIGFSDELIKNAKIEILDENGNELVNTSYKTIQNNTNELQEVFFDGLQSNTQYKIKIYDILYDGATQTSSNWMIYYDDCKTLKTKASINQLNYTIDKRNGKFKLIIENIQDKDNSIQNYKYIVYEYKKIIDSQGKETLEYDTDNIIYTRETKDTEITIDVSNDSNTEGIKKETYYGFKVVANVYDNEKYVEIASNNICGTFILNGKSFPTVKFTSKEITATKIEGTLYISDAYNTITINEENPLKVMYKNDIGDEETFITIKDINAVNKEKDENGEDVIAIPVALEKLKSETSYVFSIYGSVDLEDDNSPYSNIFIGSAIVNTLDYKEMKVNFSQNNKDTTKTFAVDVNLEGEEFEKESIESVTFIMQEGANFRPTDKYWSLVIDNEHCAKYASYTTKGGTVENLKDLLCGENALTITPSLIGGGQEKDYTELKYVILVTVTVDGTKYANKIPIYAEENKEKITFTDKKGENYTTAYIVMDGDGTTASIPENTEQALTVKAITNGIANSYQMYDNRLNDDTIVGYEVKANFNMGTRTADSITYYVWDKDGNPIYDGEGNQLTYTAKFLENKKTPSAIFEVNDGTLNAIADDNKKGLFRGGAYYFTYTVTYTDKGYEEIWPTMLDSSMNEKSLKSEVQYPNKQEPSFVMYPKTSDSNSMTYIYSCYDYDKALNYDYEDKTMSSLELNADETSQGNYEINTNANNIEIAFGTTEKPLQKGSTYIIKYKRLLNKAKSSNYIAKTLVTQKFGGITNIGNITYEAKYDNAKSPNKLIIELLGATSDLEKVAGAKVILKLNENNWPTDLLNLKYDENNNKYYIEVDLLSLGISSAIINQTLDVEVEVYYDNDRIGFDPDKITEENGNGDSEYAAFVNATDDYHYMTIDEEGNFIVDKSHLINGNGYKYILDTKTSNEYAYLTITDISGRTKTLELKYTDAGFVYGEDLIVQKNIYKQTIDTETEHKITINSIVAGIEVENIETQINKAIVKAQIINPLGLPIKDNKIYVEVAKLNNKNDSVSWDDVNDIREIPLNQISEFTLSDLTPAKYYKIRFKYMLDGDTNYSYMYDVDTYTLKKEYEFETLATIGIENINIQYEANTYQEKYLNITYNIDSKKSNMYEKTKYEFYEYNENTEKYESLKLKDENIWKSTDSGNTYEVVNGVLYVTNSIYNNTENKTYDSVLEKIDINPTKNIFTFGNKYKLVIIPIVSNNGDEIELEKVEKEITLSKLSSPTFGIKMIREEDADGNNKRIRASITIGDNDKVIYGAEYGEYTLKAYKYGADGVRKAVKIYSNKGEDIRTDTILNINKNAASYNIYIKDDVDFSYNYELEMTFDLDINNTGNKETKTETRTVQAINNDEGIVLGSTNVKANETNEKKIDLVFYNSFRITKINYIEYTVYNNDNGLYVNEKFKPEYEAWKPSTETELTTYYKLTLPVEFTTNGTYSITLNFYKVENGKELLAGTKEMNYTYTGAK